MDFIIFRRGGVSPPAFVHGVRLFSRDAREVVSYEGI